MPDASADEPGEDDALYSDDEEYTDEALMNDIKRDKLLKYMRYVLAGLAAVLVILGVGEIWKLEDELFPLVELCAQVLSDEPLFMLINSYTTGLQPAVLSNMLRLTVLKRFGGSVDADEVGLPIESGGVLPCGASGRWTR